MNCKKRKNGKSLSDLEKTPKQNKKRKIFNSIEQGKILEEMLKSKYENNKYLVKDIRKSFEHFCQVILLSSLKSLLKYVDDHKILKNKNIDFLKYSLFSVMAYDF